MATFDQIVPLFKVNCGRVAQFHLICHTFKSAQRIIGAKCPSVVPLKTLNSEGPFTVAIFERSGLERPFNIGGHDCSRSEVHFGGGFILFGTH